MRREKARERREGEGSMRKGERGGRRGPGYLVAYSVTIMIWSWSLRHVPIRSTTLGCFSFLERHVRKKILNLILLWEGRGGEGKGWERRGNEGRGGRGKMRGGNRGGAREKMRGLMGEKMSGGKRRAERIWGRRTPSN
jgi:hypothetical protein